MTITQGCEGTNGVKLQKDGVFETFARKSGKELGSLIPLLQSAQDAYGYISEESMVFISQVSGIPLSEIYGVVTFYTQFRTTPLGKYVIRVCNGTACHVNGSRLIEQTISEELKIKRDETTPDGLFTLESVACIGCCSLAPVIMINDDTHGGLSPAKVRKILREYRKKG